MGYQLFTDATADVCPEMMASLPAVEFIPMEVELGVAIWERTKSLSSCSVIASPSLRITQAIISSPYCWKFLTRTLPFSSEFVFTSGDFSGIIAPQTMTTYCIKESQNSAPGRPPPALLYTASRPGWCRKGRRRSTGIKYHPLVAGMAQRHPGKRAVESQLARMEKGWMPELGKLAVVGHGDCPEEGEALRSAVRRIPGRRGADAQRSLR